MLWKEDRPPRDWRESKTQAKHCYIMNRRQLFPA